MDPDVEDVQSHMTHATRKTSLETTMNAAPAGGASAANELPVRTVSAKRASPVVSTTLRRAPHAKESRAAAYPRPQERKRNHKKKSLEDMDAAVQLLRMEMQMLEDRRRTLSYAVNSRESHVAMISEFFRLFHYGIASPTPALVQSAQPTLQTQLSFVDSRFHHNVRSADGLGVATFLDQIRRFSLVHDDVRIELLRCVEVIPMETSTTVQFLKRFVLTITETTIQYVFPHLLRPEHHGIVAKLVGQQFSFFSNGSFVFDEAASVVEAEWTVDFVTGMLNVLTLEEVAVVLQQAQIARDAYLTNGPTEVADGQVTTVSLRGKQSAHDSEPKRHQVASYHAVVVQQPSHQASQRKREQWRRNQSRYRKQRMATIGDLEVDVARLRMDILHLEAQRRTLYETVSTRESTVGVVADILRRLRDGAANCAAALTSPEPEPELPQPQRAVVSLRFHDQSLVATKGSGLAAFVDQMRFFSLLQDEIQVDLLRCAEVSATETFKIVEVVQRLHFIASETAISHIFPQMQRQDCRQFREKVLGCRLSFPVNALFVFDAHGSVVDVHWAIDYIKGLQAVLTLEETAAILDHSHIPQADQHVRSVEGSAVGADDVWRKWS